MSNQETDEEADKAFLKKHRHRDINDPMDWDSPEQKREFVLVQRRVKLRRWDRKDALDAARYQRLKPQLQEAAHIRNQQRADILKNNLTLQQEFQEKHRQAQARYRARNREKLAGKERERRAQQKQKQTIEK
ncbi:hypothetical protein VKT23_019550 [Stygiomarasmius scandens]|uniref:Uncharacterized protein n=1 Tax=Marasmiellus scandens TaxID=2682957 RepID=A0ABR1IPI6_9AGAR